VSVARIHHRLQTHAARLSIMFVALSVQPARSQKCPLPIKACVPPAWSVRWQPATIVNGEPVLFVVNSPVQLEALSGKWLDHDQPFTFDTHTRKWYGLAGVSLDTHPGIYALELRGTAANQKAVAVERKVIVRVAKYPSISVRVAKKFTEPNAEQVQEIKQDQAVKQEHFRSVDTQREWSGRFLPPVNSPISDVFGTRRMFNGKVQSTHQGLDYAVPAGTPVLALNTGTVLLARPLYFEGNCVVLDHGQGLLTLYLHLSEFKVREGERVTRGQELGLSGDSGRATGPHLHIAVRWQGIYVNPATLMKLKLP
jgi:murein DD-endopeptidase MepM/ murein hydrolase activator NlpD